MESATAEALMLAGAVLLIVLAWRPAPTEPCRWCHLPEDRRDGCRSWCEPYIEYRDWKARR